MCLIGYIWFILYCRYMYIRLKLRYGIVCCIVFGDINLEYDWKNNKFLKLIKGYKCICILCDIFNVDEIGLFYMLMF